MSGLIYATSKIEDGNLSLKYGEETEVIARRKQFLKGYGVNLEDCVTLWLMNGGEYKVVGKRDAGQMYQVDGLITTELGVGLFMVTADCFPLVIHDPTNSVLALVHLGWQGLDRELLPKVIHQMVLLKADTNNLQVEIGPGIRKESYIFEEVVQKDNPRWQPYLDKLSNGLTSIDLVTYIKDQLVGVGVNKLNIHDCGVDTGQDKNYFSHYRSVRTGEPEGRFATTAMMK